MVDDNSIPSTPVTLPGNSPENVTPSENAPQNAQSDSDSVKMEDALVRKRNTLGTLIRQILPKHCLREREKLQKVVELTVTGMPWKDVEKKTGVAWLEISVLLRRYTAWHDLWKAARDAGEERRKEIRESEAHRRAVDGWKEPVFFQGKKCGSIMKFDSRLHELLLRADNPERFSDHSQVKHTGTGAEAGGITVNFVGVTFGQQPQYVPPPPPVKAPATVNLPPCQDKAPREIVGSRAISEGRSVTNPLPKPRKVAKQAEKDT